MITYFSTKRAPALFALLSHLKHCSINHTLMQLMIHYSDPTKPWFVFWQSESLIRYTLSGNLFSWNIMLLLSLEMKKKAFAFSFNFWLQDISLRPAARRMSTISTAQMEFYETFLLASLFLCSKSQK